VAWSFYLQISIDNDIPDTIEAMKQSPQLSWNLDDIVTLSDFSDLLDATLLKIKKYSEYSSQLAPTISEQEFRDFIAFDESVAEDMMRLDGRVFLMESVDSKDAEALSLKGKVKQLELVWHEKTQPISQWLKGKSVEGKEVLDEENAQRLFAFAGDLQYQLSYERAMADHTLSQPEELIVANKDSNGVRVVYDLYGMITTDFRFEFCDSNNKTCLIETIDELNRYTYSADPHERHEAFRSRFAEYEKNIEKLYTAYSAIVKDWVYESKVRGYSSPIAMRNAANHVSDSSIEALLSVCTDNAPLFQRFFRWKAAQMNPTSTDGEPQAIQKLRRVDLYAPLGNEKLPTLELEPTITEVLQNFAEFSPTFAEHAQKIISEHHVDFLPNPNKRSGAFCATLSPHITPYVMTNFSGRMQDKFTLAHELGHGAHGLYANKHSISAQGATLPLSETASTFAETIVFEKTLANTTDVTVKKQLLVTKILDSYASIMRQNYFTKFELAAHQASSGDFSIEVLNKLWLDNLSEQFGDSVELETMFQYEWAYIPHLFDRPFYCYAYSFGELLSMALYKRYKDEGGGFVAKIEQILATGGSEAPEDTLKKVGIDMNSADFWQGSFSIVEDWINQLEQL